MTIEDAAWVQAIAGAIQALGIIFAIDQVRLLRRQMTADHELARRSRAIDDVRAFTNSLDKAHPAARRLVDDFSEVQIGLMIDRVPISLPNENRKLADYALSDILEKYPIDTFEGGFRLNEVHLSHLLQLCSGHLNQLETALLGWSVGISDAKVIEAQFGYAISPRRGHYILEKFRQHERVRDNYPAIDAFVKEMRRTGPDGRRPPVL